MKFSQSFVLAVLAVTGCAGAPVQQPTAAATTHEVTSPAKPSASSSASVQSAISRDIVRRAKAVGLLPETHQGVTIFCKEETPLGTRFPRKTCYSGDQIVMLVEQLEQQKTLLETSRGGPQYH